MLVIGMESDSACVLATSTNVLTVTQKNNLTGNRLDDDFKLLLFIDFWWPVFMKYSSSSSAVYKFFEA